MAFPGRSCGNEANRFKIVGCVRSKRKCDRMKSKNLSRTLTPEFLWLNSNGNDPNVWRLSYARWGWSQKSNAIALIRKQHWHQSICKSIILAKQSLLCDAIANISTIFSTTIFSTQLRNVSSLFLNRVHPAKKLAQKIAHIFEIAYLSICRDLLKTSTLELTRKL